MTAAAGSTRTDPSPQNCTVAVDMGGSAAKIAYCRAAGELDHLRTVPITDIRARGGGDVVRGLVDLVDELVRRAPEGLRPACVALAVPGIVDETTRVARVSYMLRWQDAPLGELVERRTGLPTVLRHDVGSGAVAEGRLGAARGHRDWLFLALGTGLGSALVLDGRPYRGSAGWGGELGHLVVDPRGPRCPCGKRGCLETVASASGVVAAYRAAGGGDEADAERIAALAATGDPVAGPVWSAALDGLLRAVASVVEILNPSLVVVGGGMAGPGSGVVEHLTAGLPSGVRFVEPVPPVRAAELGRFAGVHGAALAGLDMLGRTVPA